MLILFVLAAVTLICGILFLGGEERLKKLDTILNKTVVKLGAVGVNKEKEKIIGILLVVFALVLFYIGFKLKG